MFDIRCSTFGVQRVTEHKPPHLIVGEIKKPHGIKGELFLIPATDDVDDVYRPGRRLDVGDEHGRHLEPKTTITVAAARSFKRGLIARFEEIRDRNVAEQFRGRTLLISFDQARPLDPNEFYLHDLAGLEVVLKDGAVVGRVAEVYEVGTGYFLGVDDGERERLIPFSRRLVREVDLDAGRIVIDPADGLLDL